MSFPPLCLRTIIMGTTFLKLPSKFSFTIFRLISILKIFRRNASEFFIKSALMLNLPSTKYFSYPRTRYSLTIGGFFIFDIVQDVFFFTQAFSIKAPMISKNQCGSPLYRLLYISQNSILCNVLHRNFKESHFEDLF